MPAVSAETAQDAAGKQLSDFNDNFQLGFDAAGRLARSNFHNTSSFQFYDLSGQRIFKTESQGDSNFDSQNPAGSLNANTAGVYYQYDQNGNLLWQQTTAGASGGLGTDFLEHEAATHYYWLPTEQGDILVGFDQGINSYAVYTDHLGTPRLVTKIENPQNPKPITDTSNDLPEAGYGQPQGISPLAIPVWQWSYSPFGADLANGYEARPTTIGNNFKPDLWAWVGLPETGGADPNQVAQETWRVQANLSTPPTLNIRYPGQYYDFESGLVQNWWRTYEPRIGRYVSADPIGLDGGWNRFAYVAGDGVNGFDKNGLQVRKILNDILKPFKKGKNCYELEKDEAEAIRWCKKFQERVCTNIQDDIRFMTAYKSSFITGAIYNCSREILPKDFEINRSIECTKAAYQIIK